MKVFQPNGDGTKETKLHSKQGNENKPFKTVLHWPTSSSVKVKELHQFKKCLPKTLKSFNFKDLELLNSAQLSN